MENHSKRFATITAHGYGVLVTITNDGTVIRRSTRRAYPGCTIQWMPENGNGSPQTAVDRKGAVLCFLDDFDCRKGGGNPEEKMARDFARNFGATYCRDESTLNRSVEIAIRKCQGA